MPSSWCSRTDGSTRRNSTSFDFISLLPLSPLGELTSWRKSISLILLGILLLSALSIFDSTAQNHIKTHTLAYAFHAPIKITGNAGFSGPNATTGITNGSGTASDPYIIEGWDIDASTANGIDIESTNAHFVIMDCYIHGGSSNFHGILITNCFNCTLTNNECRGNWWGIRLDESGIGFTLSTNIILSDNYCSNNSVGIGLGASNTIIVIGNTCLNNENDGILLSDSFYNTINNNTCSSNNFTGIDITSSGVNTLSNNTCNSNTLAGIILSSSTLNTLNNNSCSNNTRGLILGAGSGRCDLRNNSFSHNQYGIYLGLSESNNISDNSCSNNTWGICLWSSSDNSLINNNCSNNDDGIYLDSSNGNNISSNSCSDNQYGIDLLSSSGNNISSNKCNSNNHGGIELRSDYLLNTLLPADNNILIGNTCSNNHDGIMLFLSSNNSLMNNNCSSNDNDGIVIDSIGNLDVYGGNSVTRNWIFNNADYGVEIPQGSRNLVWNNTFIGNNGATDSYNSSHVQAFDGGENNSWNSTNGYGNFWKDWTTPDSVAPYGRVDSPYNIDGLPKSKDYYPLTASHIPDPPYTLIPAPDNTLVPILVIAAIAIAAIVLTSFIILRKRKGKKGAPD